jgi:hypothetical protein
MPSGCRQGAALRGTSLLRATAGKCRVQGHTCLGASTAVCCPMALSTTTRAALLNAPVCAGARCGMFGMSGSQYLLASTSRSALEPWDAHFAFLCCRRAARFNWQHSAITISGVTCLQARTSLRPRSFQLSSPPRTTQGSQSGRPDSAFGHVEFLQSQ